MKLKLVPAALFFASMVCLTPAAFAGKLDDMRHSKDTSVTLANGKKMQITIVEMHGQKMAIVPISELEALLSRAEGHSMTIN